MKCKICGNEMQKGYIQCRDGVYWSDKLRMVAAIPVGGNLLKLSKEEGGAFSGNHAEAYKCKDCRTVIINY